jgi:hypothetical protein
MCDNMTDFKPYPSALDDIYRFGAWLEQLIPRSTPERRQSLLAAYREWGTAETWQDPELRAVRTRELLTEVNSALTEIGEQPLVFPSTEVLTTHYRQLWKACGCT